MNESSTFYILDLDRTLFDTAAYSDLSVAAVRQVDTALADDLAEELKKPDVSIRAFLSERTTADFMDAFEETMRSYEPERYLMFGADRLLKKLARLSLPHGIMTYGDVANQTRKLELSGTDTLPYVIVSEQAKGKIIASYKQPDGSFILPEPLDDGVTPYKHVSLTDDKARSFAALPEGAIGNWLTQHPDNETLPAYEGLVRVIHYLDEITDSFQS